MICYDCKTETSEYVMEKRQTSGGGQGDLHPQVYEGDFTDVPVHADRRVCLTVKAAQALAVKRGIVAGLIEKDPFSDIPD